MRTFCTGALIALAACASSPPPGGGVAPASRTTSVSVPIDGQNRWITIHSEGGAVTGYSIAAAPARAWTILPQLYDDLGFSLTLIDAPSGTVRGQRLRSHAYLMGHPLSDFLDCGTTAGVPNVGRYDLDIYLTTRLRKAGGDSTLVQSAVQAYAKPPGTAGEPTECEANQKIGIGIATALANALNQP